MSRYPAYDPEKGGNRFAWIIEQSRLLRAEHQAARRDLFKPEERRTMQDHDAKIEAEEVAHFAILRARRAAKLPKR